MLSVLALSGGGDDDDGDANESGSERKKRWMRM